MFPFTIRFRKKIRTQPEFFSAYLNGLKISLERNLGLSQVDVKGNSMFVSTELIREWKGTRFYRPSLIGVLNSFEVHLSEKEGERYLDFKVSYIPLFGLSFALLPFLLIPLLPGGSEFVTFASIWKYWAGLFGIPYLISLGEYVFYFATL